MRKWGLGEDGQLRHLAGRGWTWRRRGRERAGGKRARDEEEEKGVIKRVATRISAQDQFKFAVRLGFIIDDAVNDITPGKLGSYSGG